MKYQCEHSDTGLCFKCFKGGEEVNRAYDLLWELFARVRDDKTFTVATEDTDGNEVVVTVPTDKLLAVINSIDTMCGR